MEKNKWITNKYRNCYCTQFLCLIPTLGLPNNFLCNYCVKANSMTVKTQLTCCLSFPVESEVISVWFPWRVLWESWEFLLHIQALIFSRVLGGQFRGIFDRSFLLLFGVLSQSFPKLVTSVLSRAPCL